MSKSSTTLPQSPLPIVRGSRSKFGRDAEITIALHIMSKGWDVKFSRGSRGPVCLKENPRMVYTS